MFVQFYLSYALVAWLFGVNGWEAAFVPALHLWFIIWPMSGLIWRIIHQVISRSPLGDAIYREAHMQHHFHNENFN